jgi:hypothetical protein
MRSKPQSLVFLYILILSACSDFGITPSKERFEKNCHITIPNDVKVAKDDYEDMTSDYVINYTLKFTTTSLKDFIKNIRQSDYYNKFWSKSTRGYAFYKKTGNREFTEYKIDVDTTTQTAFFQEDAN